MSRIECEEAVVRRESNRTLLHVYGVRRVALDIATVNFKCAKRDTLLRASERRLNDGKSASTNFEFGDDWRVIRRPFVLAWLGVN